MTIQILDQVEHAIGLHEKAVEHLRAYKETLHMMQGNLEAFGQTTASKTVTSTDSVTSTPKKISVVAKKTRGEDNDISLREAVWNVITRKENAKGMKVASIISVIKDEEIWKTDGDLANMVHGAVYKFKQEGKLVRGDDRTYKISEN